MHFCDCMLHRSPRHLSFGLISLYLKIMFVSYKFIGVKPLSALAETVQMVTGESNVIITEIDGGTHCRFFCTSPYNRWTCLVSLTGVLISLHEFSMMFHNEAGQVHGKQSIQIIRGKSYQGCLRFGHVPTNFISRWFF